MKHTKDGDSSTQSLRNRDLGPNHSSKCTLSLSLSTFLSHLKGVRLDHSSNKIKLETRSNTIIYTCCKWHTRFISYDVKRRLQTLYPIETQNASRLADLSRAHISWKLPSTITQNLIGDTQKSWIQMLTTLRENMDGWNPQTQ